MFKNREEAGDLLAERLRFKIDQEKLDLKRILVIAIPRGGVVVGRTVANILNLPLNTVVVKKIGAPFNAEFAIGAIGSNGIVFWEEKIIKNLNLDQREIQKLKLKKAQEVEQKEKFLQIKEIRAKEKIVMLIDDGIATGATVITASKVLKDIGASKIILAVPVLAEETFEKIKNYFDEIIYILKPSDFNAVGEFYQEFKQVSDEKVKKLLEEK